MVRHRYYCIKWQLSCRMTKTTVWTESLLCALRIANGPRCPHAASEGTDQTGQMPRLICVFAGCTVHFVGIVALWFNYMLTIMTWVTVLSASSFPISVLSKTPFVQKVNRVFGETLEKVFVNINWQWLYTSYLNQMQGRSDGAKSWTVHSCQSL